MHAFPSELANPIEHIVVSDGPDSELAEKAAARRSKSTLLTLPEHVNIGYEGVFPRLMGIAHARGDCFAFLDDDNSWRPQHLAVLHKAIIDESVDFAFSQMQRWCRGAKESIIGSAPPCEGAIDTSIFLARRALFERETWDVAGRPHDWDLIRRWLAGGATYTFVHEVTVDYYMR